jgi:hypothetical protein
MTLQELETAVAALPVEDKRQLSQFLLAQLGEDSSAQNNSPRGHSVLDIPAFSVGKILIPLSSEDDLLGEMLEGRS